MLEDLWLESGKAPLDDLGRRRGARVVRGQPRDVDGVDRRQRGGQLLDPARFVRWPRERRSWQPRHHQEGKADERTLRVEMDAARNWQARIGRDSGDRVPVPPRSRAVAMLRQREDADDKLATIARDIEIERVRRGIDAAEDRRGAGRARARIDRARDARELVFAQRTAPIV